MNKTFVVISTNPVLEYNGVLAYRHPSITAEGNVFKFLKCSGVNSQGVLLFKG